MVFRQNQKMQLFFFTFSSASRRAKRQHYLTILGPLFNWDAKSTFSQIKIRKFLKIEIVENVLTEIHKICVGFLER